MKTKFATVGDITIAYKVFGKGQPLILIMGYMGTMACWDKQMLNALSRHYRVIIFDNRGMGDTSASEKKFSVRLFADDTANLMKALKIRSAHILGWSMGSNIALEFCLKYPKKVNRLILYAADCGGKKSVQINPKLVSKRNQRLAGYLPKIDCCVSEENKARQTTAVEEWKGVYNRLGKIKAPTLAITGSDDALIPPANSALIAKRIKNSWLVQIKRAGHGAMYQYPKGFSGIVHTFLQA